MNHTLFFIFIGHLYVYKITLTLSFVWRRKRDFSVRQYRCKVLCQYRHHNRTEEKMFIDEEARGTWEHMILYENLQLRCNVCQKKKIDHYTCECLERKKEVRLKWRPTPKPMQRQVTQEKR